MGDGEAEAGADAMLMPCPMGGELSHAATLPRADSRALRTLWPGSETQAGALTDAVAKGYALFFPSYLPITASQPLISAPVRLPRLRGGAAGRCAGGCCYVSPDVALPCRPQRPS
jgi:hypothetical protein